MLLLFWSSSESYLAFLLFKIRLFRLSQKNRVKIVFTCLEQGALSISLRRVLPTLQSAFTSNRQTMTKSVQSFEVGDRVAERPKNSLIQFTTKEGRQRAAANSGQRYGTLVECVLKKNARKDEIRYWLVLWDGSKTPSLHCQGRLCRIEEHAAIAHDYREGLGI